MPAVHSRVFSARSSGPPQYSFAEIREKATTHFGYTPCLWQIQVVEAILKRDGDVVCISATGSGKTLTFWLPLLFRADGIQLVISPLNILGDQNVQELKEMNIEAIAITSETATFQNFQVSNSMSLLKSNLTSCRVPDIEDGKYRAIITNVETLMQQDGGFEKLWKKPNFTSRLMSIVWDEGHCVSKWAGFRPEYKEAARLRFLIPRSIPFVIVSATLPPAVLSDANAHPPSPFRPIREMKYAMNSFQDLAFLIPPNWKPGDPLPPKFLIFFDNIADSVAAANYLRARLPPEYRHKIKWFNSEMSTEFKEDESGALKSGEIWGLCCTDSFGMGLNLADILLVIQWRSTCDMCSLWQRLGRAARALSLTAQGLFFVEPKRFDANIAKAEARALKRAEATKKRKHLVDSPDQPAAKRVALVVPGAPDVPHPSPVTVVPMAATAAPDAADDTTDPNDIPDASPDPDSLPTRPTMSLEDYRAERRAVYDAIVVQEAVWKKQTKKKGADRVEPALDDFINAGTRQPGMPCYREPAMIFFGNDKTVSTHVECPDIAGGCPRCKIPVSDVCCELCSPDDFADFARVNTIKPKPQPARSRIGAFEAEPADTALRAALNLFRKERTIEILGRASYRIHGAGAIMSDEVLYRIVDCAHFGKIQTTADLLKETNWHRTTDDGAKVLALITLHRPLPPPISIPTTSPLRAATISNNVAATSAPKKRNKCSKCGLEGHISSNSKCAMFTPRTPRARTARNENISPHGRSCTANTDTAFLPSHHKSFYSSLHPLALFCTCPMASSHYFSHFSSSNCVVVYLLAYRICF
ncbi:P-loop containing nucleoside triphosphate hydrolase protein [Mycena rebaudengoi]|nr:P-loop containing nucleoside triphosphate hydrolase protein [Mycena rebaudengoi]